MTVCNSELDYPIKSRTSSASSARVSKPAGRKRKKKSRRRSFTNLHQVNPNAAGIDIASGEHWVCIPPDRTKDNVRKFGPLTCDLHAISAWLREHNVTTVAMESTGIYWIPLFQRLEADGFEVFLVNARDVKNVPGRPKTDRLDCQWLQKLHTFGLLRASFRPTDQVCKVRSILRHRESLISLSSVHIQHMQKCLREMNVLLDTVISDITGTTGMRIITAILAGERDLQKLATLKDPRVRASNRQIAKALEGDYRDEHLFILKQSLDMYQSTQSKIDQCTEQVHDLLQQWDKSVDAEVTPLPPPSDPKKRPQVSIPGCDIRKSLFEIVGVDLTQVPGFQEATVQTLISELGVDMGKWLTPNHLTSWLGISPMPDISGGKVLNRKTKRVQSRAAKAFRMAAAACKNSHSAIGAFYRRLKARIGPAKAITATARKLAVIFYIMVRDKVPYRELGEDYYSKYHKPRLIKNLQRRARSLGFTLTPIAA